MTRAAANAGLPSLRDADWLQSPQTQSVMRAIAAEGAGARAVGGAVRNSLMGLPVKDVDIATTALPDDVMRLAQRAGLHTVPTGKEHGTVTVIADKLPFEVTTLRRDIETFGRHARVTFTEDWREDAMRRDFTMNALYCDAEGNVYDPLGGYGDLRERRVRFIGDAAERIREDYLRTLRYFRFHAVYGDSRAFDAQGLAAAESEKGGLAQLSGERIRAEMLLLLAAPGAVDALRQMQAIGIIEPLLGVSGDVEAVARLAEIEAALGSPPDALLRLAVLSGEAHAAVARRLRLSAAEARRLADAACADAALSPSAGEHAAKTYIFHHGAPAFTDGALANWARSGDDARSAARASHVGLVKRWNAPEVPVRGADVVALGVPAGPAVGRVMAAFTDWWIAAGFPADEMQNRAKLEELARLELAGGKGA
jgi:poly(A) polymerase